MFVTDLLPIKDVRNFRRKIEAQAELKYGWKRPSRDYANEFLLFSRHEENDNPKALRAAILNHVTPQDIVFTTINQAHHFKTSKTYGYDISPDNLKFHYKKNPSEKLLWCDVLDESTFKSILNLICPTIVYMSNIPEYANEADYLMQMDVLLSIPSISTLMWSQYNPLTKPNELSLRLATICSDQNHRVYRYEDNSSKRSINRPIFVSTLNGL